MKQNLDGGVRVGYAPRQRRYGDDDTHTNTNSQLTVNCRVNNISPGFQTCQHCGHTRSRGVVCVNVNWNVRECLTQRSRQHLPGLHTTNARYHTHKSPNVHFVTSKSESSKNTAIITNIESYALFNIIHAFSQHLYTSHPLLTSHITHHTS